VPNWGISRNYKEIWNSTKITITSGVYLTQGGSVQRPLTSGPRGWPVGPTLQPLAGWLCGDTLQEVEGNPKLKVDGGRTSWLASHVARQAGHHLACYRPNQVNNPSLDPYKYPPAGGNQSNTLYLKFSTCKGSVWSSSTGEALT
jgi:hypothetical protein